MLLGGNIESSEKVLFRVIAKIEISKESCSLL